MMRRTILFLALLAATAPLQAQELFEQAVALIKHYETLHDGRHHPYVGYGHRLMPGERYDTMSEERADSLLRGDLRRKCAAFRRFGADSLLLGTLAYNVGEGRLLGLGGHPESVLIRKLRAGERDIHAAYVAFCRYRGRVVESLQRRREEEFKLLYLNTQKQ